MDMPIFSQKRIRANQVFPFPENTRIVEENPVCLSWLPLEDSPAYTAVLFDENKNEIWRADTKKNYIITPTLNKPGKYYWNVLANGCQRGLHEFTLSKNAVMIHRVSAKQLYDCIPDKRPRHLFFESDISKLIDTKATEVTVLKRNIEAAYKNGMPDAPMYHKDPNALPYREYFGRFRDFCDRDLVACSLGYALLGDEKAGLHAKQLLFTICDWSPYGPCDLNGPWGDEIGLSLSRCLPSVFDLLYPMLDEKERIFIARMVKAYGAQCWERLKRIDFCANPGDSHAGRIPAYLGEAAMVLKGTGVQTEEEAIAWLDYALDIYGGIFPHFGSVDGGWAEGPFYSTSYTKWYLPFFCAVERYTPCRFLDRPFYQRLPHYFLHFANPEYENHPFGDGYWCRPEDKEWPGFFAQNPLKVYCDRSDSQRIKQQAKEAADQKLYLLHLLDLFIPQSAPPKTDLSGEAKNMHVFPDTGYISMHTDIFDTKNDFALLARASKFGSDSHRHPDQGSFALFFGGKALISPSGYFGRAYGTKHHVEWLNSTRAHNAILINGEGQPFRSMNSVGRIVSYKDEGEYKYAKVDISDSYDALTEWTREFELCSDKLTIRDHVKADRPVIVTYPLHSLVLSKAKGNSAVIERENAVLTVTPVSGDLKDLLITDKFQVDLNEGEPEKYHVTMPPQFHLSWTTDKKAEHDIEVTYTLTKK
ncbi:MAG: DUF4962 domain-containing protein [Clostridiales bacterium]|nr:DUF4962 domain-containing protein [Clostridiales bacterium]